MTEPDPPQDALTEQLRESHERILCLQLTLANERKQHRAKSLGLEQAMSA